MTVLAIVLTVLASNGCAPILGSAAVGAATAYQRGEYGGYVDAPLSTCESHTRHVAAGLNLTLTERNRTRDKCLLLYHNADAVPFRILLEPIASGCTRVSIRVGIWGDDVCAAKLIAEIRRSVAGVTKR